MYSKRLHAEWLSLVEVSGPFLTMPVLERVFPQGLDAHDPEHFRNLRLAFEEWEDNQESYRPNPAIHNAWIKFVLKETLGFPDEVLAEGQAIPQSIKATVAEHGETLRPDFVVRNPQDDAHPGKPQLLLQVYPRNQNLEKPVAGRHWKASPSTRMMELLHSTDVPLGLVTNGEHWMMVAAPRNETTGFASWYASLWLEEKITLQAFRSLLGVSRFFSVPDAETLEAMLAESARHQQEVTDQLGYQVRRAVEVLVQSLDFADQNNRRELLRDVPETALYEAALTVMMRLVILFCAEERELLLLGDPLYDQHYGVSTLVAQLQEAADQHGEEVLERRLDAWVRLLATFRAVYGGVQHVRMKLPPYGGNLFNPDRFPFLEGRRANSSWREIAADPLPINNRTVLHLLRSLQYLEMQGEARRLSFRALDIEQIGHVYEGLLDHTAKRAPEPVLGLVGKKGDEPEVPLSKLEQIKAKGEDTLLEFLKEETGKSVNALRRALNAMIEAEEINRLRAACGNDEALFKRIRPFAGVIRNDTFDRPVVIRKGSVYVTAGTDRRSSATHYTQRSLTEPIVQYALEPLVYIGPAECKPKEEWQLRSPRELLDLKICDMACGSGAFLVQACRYLSELLIEAWEREAENVGREAWGVGGDVIEKENQSYGHSELPRTGSMANRDGIGGTVLSSNEIISQRRDVRDDEPDSSSSSFRTGKHSGRTRTPAYEGISEFPEHGQRIIEGTGDTSDTQSESGSAECRESGEASGIGGSNQQDVVIAETGSRKAPLTTPHAPPTTPHASPSTGRPDEIMIPKDEEERLVYARRLIAQRCLYGVDKNQFAVEMAKLSLWLLTLTKDKPFTFLDHAIRCGDSLVGIHHLDQIKYFNFDLSDKQRSYLPGAIEKAVQEVISLRKRIEASPSNLVADIEAQAHLLDEAEAKAARLRYAADLLVSVELQAASQRDKEDLRNDMAIQASYYTEKGSLAEFHRAVEKALNGQATFHWPLEFPEVFVERGGFDAIVCNPPFIGGQKITGILGTSYRNFVIEYLANGKKGSADLSAYFFLQAKQLLRPGGHFGLLATNTIAQGDTREVGLDQIASSGGVIYRAVPSRKWPGVASLEVAEVWIRNGDEWRGEFALDEAKVSGITPFLTKPGKAAGKPYRLVTNADKSFIGSYVLGMGFVLTPEEAQELIAKDERNRDVLFPYLNGEDLNSRPDQSPSRWVINFRDWPLDRSASGSWMKADKKEREQWLRAGLVPVDYPNPVAADYTDCLKTVVEKVKPERDKVTRKVRRERWWQFAEKAPALYDAIAGMERVLMRSRVANINSIAFEPTTIVYSEATVIFAFENQEAFALLQSAFHTEWLAHYASSMRTDIRYTPSDCFETFPFPTSTSALDEIGERYYAHRQSIMLAREEGLTKTYNRFHSTEETAEDIQHLRDLHVEMDYAVAAAYGWNDLKLNHDFHQTKQGIRFTISEEARREVLDRLLELNHARYAEEARAGLHDKKAKGKRQKAKGKRAGLTKDAKQRGLF